MTVNDLLHSLVLQGHKIPTKLIPPIEAEYYSNSKKEYKTVGEMDLFHMLFAFIKGVDSDVKTQENTDRALTINKADIRWHLRNAQTCLNNIEGVLDDK
jgi:hypothetical protein|tara:strand:- start:707 stop:1003 length:297 start_codon:yes stop_codon:yes gene_type:complete